MLMARQLRPADPDADSERAAVAVLKMLPLKAFCQGGALRLYGITELAMGAHVRPEDRTLTATGTADWMVGVVLKLAFAELGETFDPVAKALPAGISMKDAVDASEFIGRAWQPSELRMVMTSTCEDPET